MTHLLGPAGEVLSVIEDKPRRKEFQVGFPDAELTKFRDWAAERVKDPDALRDDVLLELTLLCKALAERIKKPPRGRSGINFVTRAIPVYRDTMGAVLGALDKRRKMKDEIARAVGALPSPDVIDAQVLGGKKAQARPRERAGGGRARGKRRPPGNRVSKIRPPEVMDLGPVGVPDGEGPRRPPDLVDEGRGRP